MRKRHTYGTVLVDLDRHRPVALLPDREAETLATWLREHPGVEVISRDRASAYAAGGRSGAPDAVQVADRFHLLQNLAEALELAFTGHARELQDAEQARRQDVAAEGGPVRPDPPPPKRPLAMAVARREQRMTNHRQVWDLYRQGWPGERIARHLGIGRTTAYRHLKSEVFPERKGRSDAGRSSMDPWRDWIIERWNRGQRNGRQTLRDLRAKANVDVLRWPCGTLASRRSPRGALPYSRTMLVLTEVSSKKNSLAGFRLGCLAFQAARAAATSARSCSAACSVFFLCVSPSLASVPCISSSLAEMPCTSPSQRRNSAKVASGREVTSARIAS